VNAPAPEHFASWPTRLDPHVLPWQAAYENDNDRTTRSGVQCYRLGWGDFHSTSPRRRFLPPPAHYGRGGCWCRAPCLSALEPRLARICPPPRDREAGSCRRGWCWSDSHWLRCAFLMSRSVVSCL